MKHTRSEAACDAGHEIGAGAALLVHDAHLHRVLREFEHRLDAAEDLVGEGDLVGPVHLRLDDIERAGAAVVQRLLAVDVVAGDEGRHHRVEQVLGDLAALGVPHGVGEHVQADVAQQHEAAARQAQFAAARALVDAVAVQHAVHRLAVLLEGLAQVPFMRPSQLR